MLIIKELNHRDVDKCFEIDSNTISLWSKKQWYEQFNKIEKCTWIIVI